MKILLKTFSNILIVILFLFVAMIISSICDTKRGLWEPSSVVIDFKNCEFLCRFHSNDEVEVLASCDGIIFDRCEYSDGHIVNGKSYKKIICCNNSFNRCLVLFTPSDKIAL